MFPEYMHLRQRSHDISNSSIYIHVYYTCNNSSSSPSSRYQPRHIPYWFKFFFYSKEIFFNIERNDMLIQNICYLSVITILNCQLPDCNENMKKIKTLTYPCKGLIIFLFFFISVILSLKEFKPPSFWWLKWQYSWKRTCV